MNRIRQHLTLATRDRKNAPNLADAASSGRHRPSVLGPGPDRLGRRTLHAEDGRRGAAARRRRPGRRRGRGDRACVVDAVATARSTWTRWNLTAETMRQLAARGWQFDSTADAVQVRDRIVAAAERLSSR